MVEPDRQAGVDIEITEAMIQAGYDVYEKWEPNHIFDVGDEDPTAAPYAIRELVRAILYAALMVSNIRAPEGNQQVPK